MNEVIIVQDDFDNLVGFRGNYRKQQKFFMEVATNELAIRSVIGFRPPVIISYLDPSKAVGFYSLWVSDDMIDLKEFSMRVKELEDGKFN